MQVRALTRGLWVIALVLAPPVRAVPLLRQLQGVELHGAGAEQSLAITTSSPPNFTSFKLNRPTRIVVDFPETATAALRQSGPDEGPIVRWSVEPLGTDDQRVARLTVELRIDAEYTLKSSGSLVELKLVVPATSRPLVALENERGVAGEPGALPVSVAAASPPPSSGAVAPLPPVEVASAGEPRVGPARVAPSPPPAVAVASVAEGSPVGTTAPAPEVVDPAVAAKAARLAKAAALKQRQEEALQAQRDAVAAARAAKAQRAAEAKARLEKEAEARQAAIIAGREAKARRQAEAKARQEKAAADRAALLAEAKEAKARKLAEAKARQEKLLAVRRAALEAAREASARKLAEAKARQAKRAADKRAALAAERKAAAEKLAEAKARREQARQAAARKAAELKANKALAAAEKRASLAERRDKAGAETTAKAIPPERGASAPSIAGSAKALHPATLGQIGFKRSDGSAIVVLHTSAPITYALHEDTPTRLVLDLERTQITVPNNRLPLDTHYFGTAVSRIVPHEDRAQMRVSIEIDLAAPVPYEIQADGDTLRVKVNELPAANAQAGTDPGLRVGP